MPAPGYPHTHKTTPPNDGSNCDGRTTLPHYSHTQSEVQITMLAPRDPHTQKIPQTTPIDGSNSDARTTCPDDDERRLSYFYPTPLLSNEGSNYDARTSLPDDDDDCTDACGVKRTFFVVSSYRIGLSRRCQSHLPPGTLLP
jgi:hypothetical protein